MPLADVNELHDEPREAVLDYLAKLEAGFCAVSASIADDVLAETRSHLLSSLSPDSTLADVLSAVSELGPPDEYAAAMCAEIKGGKGALRVAASGAIPDEGGRGSGSVLGVPYDIRLPTAERIRSRFWNPEDSRVFTPRAWGIGWDLNFGALAVKTHLIRPDDHDDPFAHVPEVWLYVALAIPLAICALMAVSWVVAAPNLPSELPTHWGISGQADRFAPAVQALGMLLVLSAAPTIWAIYGFVMGRSKAGRALISAFATMISSVAGVV
ncbi:MAG: DUF1648 domain-containing protein, partial [Actinomycetota bacterium]|nr:DUF1648 domain-containing protein [Actinomycetota bacterium]